MEILVLGTGTAFSHQHYNTNFLISWNNTNLLVDCGLRCPTAFHKLGIPISRIQNIFITHTHADHIGGLEEVALNCKYYFNTHPNIYLPEAIRYSLWENSLKGGLQYNVTGYFGLEDYFEPHTVQHSFMIDQMQFELLPTVHIGDMPSYGLLFNDIAYSSDTIFNRDWILQILERARILIHDCSFTRNPVHAYYQELLTLPRRLYHRIYLTHYNDDSQDKLDFMQQQGFHYLKPFTKLKVIR